MRNLSKALAATAVLIGVVVGLPVLFLRVGSWPIHHVPSLDALRALPTKALTDDAVLAVLTVAAWVAWAAFTASVLIEVGAQTAGTPRWRVPLAGPVQGGARQLVASMFLVLSVGGPLGGHALAAPLPRAAAATIPSTQAPTTSITPSREALMRVPDSVPPATAPSPDALVRLPGEADPVTTPPDGAVPPTDAMQAAGTPTLDAALPISESGSSTTASATPQAPPARPVRPPSGPAITPGATQQTSGASGAAGTVPTSAPRSNLPTGAGDASLPQIVVAPGDSPWSLAERHLDDGLRWREIFDLNQPRTQSDGTRWSDPQRLSVGWVLSLPADASGVPVLDPGPTVPASWPTAPDTMAASTSWTVQPGDTLAGIADAVWGDATRFGDLFDANAGNPQPDGRTLADPNLILPGWVIDLREPHRQLATPSSAGDETAPALPEMVAPTEAQTDPPADRSGTDESPNRPETPGTETPDTETPGTETPDTETPGATEGTDSGSSSTSPAPTPVGLPIPPVALTEESDELLPALVPAIFGISGALVLATAAAERLRRARQRRSLRAARLGGTSSGDLADPVERAVLATSDVPLVRWAGQVVAQAMATPEATHARGVPVVIELGEDGIEVRWSAPSPPVPAAWSLGVGGWSWHLPYDPDAPVPADERTAPLPALVTLGRRGSHSVLLNVEAFGALGVSGPPDAVAGLLRSMATELSTGNDLSHAYVSVVNLTVPHDPTSPSGRLRTVTIEEAHARLSATVDAASTALDADRFATTFAHRTGPDGVPLEVIVVVVNAPDDDAAAQLIAAAPAHRGVGLVLDDEPGRCDARVVINDDGHAVLYPLGIGFTAANLPAETADALARVGEQTTDAIIDLTTVETPLPDCSCENVPTPPSLLVRVLGTPRVSDRTDLGARGVSLVAYLACRQRPATTSHIQEALWGGRPVQAKTIWNVVSRTRVALGTLPDGSAAFPPGDATTRTFTLATGVGTDAGVLRAAYEHHRSQPDDPAAARALEEALDLVEGPPFDGPGFDWAYREGQHAAAAGHLVEQAALAAANTASQRGDLAAARHAIAQGLVGLPGNEVLYRARLTLEAVAGNRVGVEANFRELVGFLEDLDAEPSPETVAHYAGLLRPNATQGTKDTR